MCNRYGYLAPVTRLMDTFSEVGIPLRFKDGAIPNVEARDHIRPTNHAPIVRPLDPAHPGEGVGLSEVRWGLVPFFHKLPAKDWKMLGTNARAESVATTGMYRGAYVRRRCLVPATHYFEWTGEKGAKVMWRFAEAGADIFCFAGLWDRAGPPGEEFESFTILTSAPGPDQAPYHNREPVIVPPARWADWLDLGNDMAPAFTGSPAGTRTVERAATVN